MAGTQAGGKEGEARCGLPGCHAGRGCCGHCLYGASSVGQGQGTETTFLSVSLCLNHLAKGDGPMLSFQGLKSEKQGWQEREGGLYLSITYSVPGISYSLSGSVLVANP